MPVWADKKLEATQHNTIETFFLFCIESTNNIIIYNKTSYFDVIYKYVLCMHFSKFILYRETADIF